MFMIIIVIVIIINRETAAEAASSLFSCSNQPVKPLQLVLIKPQSEAVKERALPFTRRSEQRLCERFPHERLTERRSVRLNGYAASSWAFYSIIVKTSPNPPL